MSKSKISEINKSVQISDSDNGGMMEDWVECELKDVCRINMGQSPPSSTYNVDGIGLPFFQGKAGFTDLYPVVTKWCSQPKKEAKKGDILLSVRAPVGSTNIANQDCAIGRGLAAISYKFGYKFIWYYLKSVEAKLDSLGTGTTFKAISGGTLKSQIISLPPLPIQRAIVSKIEGLFSSLDSGIADLKKAQEQLKIYRQAVLKKAFEGELTNVKMAINKLSDECKIIMGQSPPGTSYNQEGVGIPLINGPVEFGIGPLGKTVKSKWTTKPTKLCEKGDLILCVRGSTTGKTNIADFDACVGRGVAAIRYKRNQQYLNSYMLYKRYEIFSKGTGTTFPSVSSRELREFDFPVCSIKQQKQIIKEIESRLSVCDKVEESIVVSLEKAQALRQSILKKAFEGKLLTTEEIEQCKQEADYEHAGVLLARIKNKKKK